jgi:alanine racemase
MRVSQLVIDLDKIEHNIKKHRELLDKNVRLMAVLKGNAYGMGAVPVAKAAVESGADWIAVATREEAQELIENGISLPILILGYTGEDDYEYVIANDVRPAVYSYDIAKAYSKKAVEMNKRVKVHVKIDTGLHRIGFDPDESGVEAVKKILELPNIDVEGIYTHFANADAADDSGMRKAFGLFKSFLALLGKNGIHIPIAHCANSVATMRMKECHLDMVRIAISMYGEYPCEESKVFGPKLEPVVMLKSILIAKRWIPEGTPVSYFYQWISSRKSLIGTIPIGYYDGFYRNYFNRGSVLINGVRVPIVGKLCMDMMMIDLTDVPVAKVGDEVILIGRQGDEEITVDEVAYNMSTINYEVLIRISSRVPRVYVHTGDIAKV